MWARTTSIIDSRGGPPMYIRNGDSFFVVDGHIHFWDASPENWVSGQERYAKGWIDCFHAYMGLAPPETHWPIEKFQKYSEEDFVKDVFEDGYADVGIFQPTYLKEWYREGFNTLERNARLVEKYPDRLIANGRSDPHKGPTIWPLDKDAFDVSDVDYVATNFPELNFIVEHVGLPRIEDFCFMATQEPNVYAGLAVVIGGLMHARPRFFAKVMGELLFWVGEDKMLWASDYAIWEPRWQVEGFVDWTYPGGEEYSDYPPLTTAGKKKILGLNAAKLYGIDVPEELRLPDETPAAREDAQLVRDSA